MTSALVIGTVAIERVLIHTARRTRGERRSHHTTSTNVEIKGRRKMATRSQESSAALDSGPLTLDPFHACRCASFPHRPHRLHPHIQTGGHAEQDRQPTA